MEIFDEDKAVTFIKAELENNSDITKKYSGDDILEIIDIIWDYYEENGLLDLDMTDDSEEGDNNADRKLLTTHVVKMIKKDKGSSINPDDIPFIVDAELKYEDSLDNEF